MQMRGIYSVLKGKVEKIELNIEERKQGLHAKEGKYGQNNAKGRFWWGQVSGRASCKRGRPQDCVA